MQAQWVHLKHAWQRIACAIWATAPKVCCIAQRPCNPTCNDRAVAEQLVRKACGDDEFVGVKTLPGSALGPHYEV